MGCLHNEAACTYHEGKETAREKRKGQKVLVKVAGAMQF